MRSIWAFFAGDRLRIPKYIGRRVFSAGVNLTHLYWGRISLLDYLLDKELGAIAKLYRGHGLGTFDPVGLEVRREKPWIAAVESWGSFQGWRTSACPASSERGGPERPFCSTRA